MYCTQWSVTFLCSEWGTWKIALGKNIVCDIIVRYDFRFYVSYGAYLISSRTESIFHEYIVPFIVESQN